MNRTAIKIETAKTSIYNYDQKLYALQERISDLRMRLATATPPVNYNNKSYGRLVLQVISRKTGEVPIALSYYTQYAGWVAVYDIRVNSKTNKVKMVYKASLTQTTGIDWKKTKLVLSTGTPSFGVIAPVLQPWQLQLYVPGLYTDLQKRAMSSNATRNVIQSYHDDKSLSEVVVTGLGAEYKVKKDETIDPSTLTQYTTLNEGQLNNNYEIDLPYDITSDGQLHNVNIKEEVINCNLKNYAVPRMDRDAYLLAEVADWQNLDLLPGDANIIMDDTYIGKSSIDPNSIQDTLNFSLGKDKRLAVRRSLVKEMSSLKTSGKESKQSFTYEIIVKNNKVSDVNLLLKDQFPLSSIKEVEVILEDDGGAMVNRETGVLTWKVDLKPGESKKLRFSYTVKYPKDKKIVNLK
ncbi:MAG: mucoidy inhibitor MuiA family protein, partial [Pedobacter sp.]